MSVLYHPGKSNVVAVALSRLSIGSVAYLKEEERELAKEVHRLTHLGVRLIDTDDGGIVVQNGSKLSLVMEVKEKQQNDPILSHILGAVQLQKVEIALFESLYGRRCRSPIGWFEVGKAAFIRLDSILEAITKVQLIRERLKTDHSYQKSFADVRRRELEFEVCDWVFLKVSPMKGIMRFGKKGKLSPQFVGSYDIVKRIGELAYEVNLPSELVAVHPVFHVSILKKYIGNPSLIVPIESIKVKNNLSYEDIHVEILDR
ncbi:uncharacterized protein LOC124896821 [Capsicum annuum]|uniref:uncharacterized protein LOC124896821 n=1 Tax=Capsicum annuum TaxID=4072 RepID=UPI001FB17EDF|nr:uncharacterized protein LOC124896821 [Capsicum annuum]